MKIIIENFGPIHSFECDLNQDFHLMVGDNNIGKSYAITLVYLILKSLMDFSEEPYFLPFLFQQRKDEIFDMIPDEMTKLKPKDELDISNIFQVSIIKNLENTFINRFQHYIIGTYDSIDSVISQFTEEELCIKLLFNKINISIGVVDSNFQINKLELKKAIKVKCVKQNRKPLEAEAGIIFYHNHGKPEYFKDSFFNTVISFYLKLVEEVLSQIRSIHYLPASRSGLYQTLTAFGQIFAQLSKSRSFVNQQIELPGISIPLSDYFLELSEIKINKKDYENSQINIVAKDIETNILKGKVEFDLDNKKLFYTPNETSLKLDIRSTSSMVSELSPIVSFLRHVLTKPVQRNPYDSKKDLSKPLIFIEEPEAHLHPENQVKLIKAFISLIKANVKIIITSHSNYIFNQLNNLILAKEIDIESVQASILKPTKVGSKAYLLPLDDLGIEDDNFIDIAEKLYEEKVELIAKINSDV